ncbi:hypothetical protein ACFL0M_00490 [Thermodesulfobacteriota bacterium]
MGKIDPENLRGGSPYLRQMRGKDESIILQRKSGNSEENTQPSKIAGNIFPLADMETYTKRPSI